MELINVKLFIGISSNINEVIRAVLNFLLFFYKKILHAQKIIKYKKAQEHKSTKKHQKQENTTKQKCKAQISEQKKMCFKNIKGKKVTYSLICVFVFFCARKYKKGSVLIKIPIYLLT